MNVNRRDFLRAASALAAAWGLKVPNAFADANTGPNVVWLEAAACSGCSVSLLNSIYYMTIDTLLTTAVNLQYHPTVMAATGDMARDVALAVKGTTGYVLIVEGSIPTADNGAYCELWPGTSALQGVQEFGANAALVLAVGTCAAYGGIPGAYPNPTGIQSVSQVLQGKTVVNLPGCPTHPDWIVGSIAEVLAGRALDLDSDGRPTLFYGEKTHANCLYLDDYPNLPCKWSEGCNGRQTFADCPVRKWNGGAAHTPGVNWCVQSGSQCLGCTQPEFPDGMSPLYQGRVIPTGQGPAQPAGKPSGPSFFAPAAPTSPKPSFFGQQ